MSYKELSKFLSNIFDKIRTLSKCYSIKIMQSQESINQIFQILSQESINEIKKLDYYSKIIQSVIDKSSNLVGLEQEYLKLQKQLQKKQTQIRQSIRNQQEMKIYIDNIIAQKQQTQIQYKKKQGEYVNKIKQLKEENKKMKKMPKNMGNLHIHTINHAVTDKSYIEYNSTKKNKRTVRERIKTEPKQHQISYDRNHYKNQKQLEEIHDLKEEITERILKNRKQHEYKNHHKPVKKRQNSQAIAAYLNSKKYLKNNIEDRIHYKATYDFKTKNMSGSDTGYHHKSQFGNYNQSYDLKVDNHKHKEKDDSPKELNSFYLKLRK